jgi:8-oxo-dGTP pyrophosphatase MutT (NUDIX family)
MIENNNYSQLNYNINNIYNNEKSFIKVKNYNTIKNNLSNYDDIHLKQYFCNNCGITGHSFNKCKEPITSLGVIAYKYSEENEIKYLMINRKDSLGFVDFIRGKYNIRNIEYIKNIIDVMTNNEKNMILNSDFDTLWNYMWNFRNINIRYKNELEHSRRKYNNIKEGIIIDNKKYTLKELVNDSKTDWVDTEWGFPKGRRNYKETDITTALREFEEETGLTIKRLNIIKNVIPFDEVFTGSNYKSYRSRYFIGIYNDDNDDKFNKQDCEVKDIGWYTYEECLEKIRYTNYEKVKLLSNINDLIKKEIILY